MLNEANPNHSPVWLNDESSFENVSLQRVLEELERQFAVKVTVNNVNLDKKFTGTFTHKNLELALKSICEPLQLTYKISNNGAVTIDAKHSK